MYKKVSSRIPRLKVVLWTSCGLVILLLIVTGLYWKSDVPTLDAHFRWRLRPGVEVDCQKLFEGNETEIKKVKSNMRLTLISDSDKVLLGETKNCTWVEEYFGNGLYTTEVEKKFPLAFSFLVHNGAEQVIRLLKLLYRPHNQYILFPDLKSRPTFVNIFRNVAACIDNIHLVSRINKVRWGHKSIMEAQMQMYRDLMELRRKQVHNMKWKYVINLCGKELPLKSNYEIVSQLIPMNGTSVVQAHKISRDYEISQLNKQAMPFSLPLYKSMTYMALSFQFINFLFTNSSATHLYNFFKTCKMPEEHFYATVYRIPNVPGGYNAKNQKHSFNIDNYFWRTGSYTTEQQRQCSGSIVHQICIVDVGDLNRTLEAGKRALFHNKYFMDYDHVIMDCMEERIVITNQLESNY